MRTVALCSVRGAPGVTTTSLLLASRLEGAALVEADLAGGVVAVRYGLGREPGLTTLAAANPHAPGAWRDHAQDAGGVPVLVGPDAPEASESLWRTAGDRLATIIGRSDGWAIVDAGRVRIVTSLVKGADLLLVIARPTAEQIVGASHALATLRPVAPEQVAIVLVGDGPYNAVDVESGLGCTVLAHLPDDRSAAEHLVDGRISRSRLARSPLARAVAVLGDGVESTMAPASATAEVVMAP